MSSFTDPATRLLAAAPPQLALTLAKSAAATAHGNGVPATPMGAEKVATSTAACVRSTNHSAPPVSSPIDDDSPPRRR